MTAATYREYSHEEYREAAKRLTSLNHQNEEDSKTLWTLRMFLCDMIGPDSTTISREQVEAFYADKEKYAYSSSDDLDVPIEEAFVLAEQINAITANMLASPWRRDSLTEIALGMSLCPYHFVDYAICFDDDLPECAMIRLIHPGHDT